MSPNGLRSRGAAGIRGMGSAFSWVGILGH